MLMFSLMEKINLFLQNVQLSTFFGFCLVKVTWPKNIVNPLLPYRNNSKGDVLYPTGEWYGIYFSEELKSVIKYDYKFEFIQGWRFSSSHIFKDYVEHFYEIKKNSTGALRYIAKMQLNQLYGYFGRAIDLINTKNVDFKGLQDLLLYNFVDSVIKIAENLYVVLLTPTYNESVLKKL